MKNILRPSKVKIILNVLVSLGLVLAAIFFSASGIGEAFGRLSLERKALSFFLSWMTSFIIYYPLISSLAYLASCVKNSAYNVKEIIFALILIAIFNPFSISFLVSRILPKSPVLPAGTTASNKDAAENNIQPESVCGLRINEIMENSKIKEAGIEKGDVIVKFNGEEIKTVQNIFDQLGKKKPGDKVSIETGRGLNMVELAKDLSDPNRPVLGVKLEPNLCGK